MPYNTPFKRSRGKNYYHNFVIELQQQFNRILVGKLKSMFFSSTLFYQHVTDCIVIHNRVGIFG